MDKDGRRCPRNRLHLLPSPRRKLGRKLVVSGAIGPAVFSASQQRGDAAPLQGGAPARHWPKRHEPAERRGRRREARPTPATPRAEKPETHRIRTRPPRRPPTVRRRGGQAARFQKAQLRLLRGATHRFHQRPASAAFRSRTAARSRAPGSNWAAGSPA